MVEKLVIIERLPIMTYWLRKEGCNNLRMKSEWPQKGTKTPSIRDPEELQKEKKLTFVLVTGLHVMRLKHHADVRGVRYKSSGEVLCMISQKKERKIFSSRIEDIFHIKHSSLFLSITPFSMILSVNMWHVRAKRPSAPHIQWNSPLKAHTRENFWCFSAKIRKRCLKYWTWV